MAGALIAIPLGAVAATASAEAPAATDQTAQTVAQDDQQGGDAGHHHRHGHGHGHGQHRWQPPAPGIAPPPPSGSAG
ncbi:hypothetical protein D5S18_12735 [Nocardia panacis]|uniref:Uncharacterized protein n=1 Tax=Nocardia panacis TaxID=2340916 RepID=A0A3A4KNA5_9NOCA|nr:hypothetical protein D5S18_12735 [Nocardia panacis]